MADQHAPFPDIPGLRLDRRIGSGGFATVYEAWQERQDRAVAVKVLKGDHFDPTKIRQFEAEAKIMGRVSNHPYIVTIYDADVTPDGRPFIVMELYRPKHFGYRAAGGRLRESEVLRVGVNIASAVETAHRSGIIHRDIKPENILTNDYGRPALTDFGISSMLTDDLESDDGALTVAYAAPELLRGTAPPSVVSDVYALAATLWTLLTGQSPYGPQQAGETPVALMGRILSAPLPQIRRDGVHPRFHQLLRQSLDKDPAARPATILEFAQALRRIEIDLGLPPTDLELPDGAADDFSFVEPTNDGTRPDTIVLPPDRPSGRAGASGTTTAGGTTSAPIGNATVVRTRDGEVQDESDAPESSVSGSSRKILVGVGAGVLVVAAAVIGITVIGGEPERPALGSANVTATSVADLGDPIRVPRLTDVAATRVDATTVSLEWTITNHADGDVVLIRRVDPGEEWSSPIEATSSPVEIPVEAGSQPYFDVRAAAGSRLSETQRIFLD